MQQCYLIDDVGTGLQCLLQLLKYSALLLEELIRLYILLPAIEFRNYLLQQHQVQLVWCLLRDRKVAQKYRLTVGQMLLS